MDRKWSLLIIVLASTTFLYGQPLTKKEWKSAIKAHHSHHQHIAKAKNYRYQEVPFERADFFVEVPSSAEVSKTRELVAKTAKVEVLDEGMGSQLAFEANISAGYPAFISDQIDITFIAANLEDEEGQTIALTNAYQSGATEEAVIHRTGIEGQPTGTITGKATYEVSFLLRYDELTLTAENTGETFTLAGCDFRLIEVLHNQVILEKSCDIEPQLINWGREGHVLTPYPYNELMEMAANDPSVDTDGSFSQLKTNIPKKVYQLFKAQPGLSVKQLRKAVPMKAYDQLYGDDENYLVLSNIATIKGKFTLFAPVYETDRVVVRY